MYRARYQDASARCQDVSGPAIYAYQIFQLHFLNYNVYFSYDCNYNATFVNNTFTNCYIYIVYV